MKVYDLVSIFRRYSADLQVPLIDQIIQEFEHNPYLILIACLLSLRARDRMTIHVCRDLFGRVKTPQELLALGQEKLENIIFRTGYYKTKAGVLRHVSQEIISRFQGIVPGDYESLMSIKGIGPKTANLVLGMGFGVPALCVDVHVHRISNRLGLICTKNVEKTETMLKEILPKNLWIEWNKLLVMWGQNICGPVSPFCSRCPLSKGMCARVGVKKMR